MEIVVALVVTQFSELFVPLLTLAGFAAKDVIAGMDEAGGVFGVLVVALPQADKTTQAAKARTRAQALRVARLPGDLKLLPQKELGKNTIRPSPWSICSSLVIAHLAWLLAGGTESGCCSFSTNEP
jgi:hypothetical protein